MSVLKKLVLLICLITPLWGQKPTLTLPFPINEDDWRCTNGYNQKTGPIVTHTDGNNGYYALDFSSNNKDNRPVLAAAPGKVILAELYNGYGNAVKIDHGGGYVTLYGHMKDKSFKVKSGDIVLRGQQLGTMGSTGHSTAEHIHFQLNYNGKCSSSVPESKPEPMSGYVNMVEGAKYLSKPYTELGIKESNEFVYNYYFYGGPDVFGPATDRGYGLYTYLWPDNNNRQSLLVQDFKKGEVWSELVYNPTNNKVFAVFNKILTFWRNNNGWRDYGVPIQNEQLYIYIGDKYGTLGDPVVAQKFYPGAEPIKVIIYNSKTYLTTSAKVGVVCIQLPPKGYVCENINGNLIRFPDNTPMVTENHSWLVDAGSHFFYLYDSNGTFINSLPYTVLEGNHAYWQPNNTQIITPPTESWPDLFSNTTLGGGAVSLSTTSLYFDYSTGAHSKKITIDCTMPNGWAISPNVSWLSPNKWYGNGLATEVEITIAYANIPYGISEGRLTINYDGGQQTIRVIAQKDPPQTYLWSQPTELDFGSGAVALSVTVKILSDTGDLSWRALADQPWIGFTKDQGYGEGVLQVLVDRKNLSGGAHSGTVTIKSNGAQYQFSVKCSKQGDPAQTTTVKYYVSAAGDGYVGNGFRPWQEVRDASSGGAVYTQTIADNFGAARHDAGNGGWSINRGMFGFNTASIPDNATISAAKIGIWFEKRNGFSDDEWHIVAGNQASLALLSGDDFNKTGSFSFANILVSSATFAGYTVFNLNSTGLDNISKTNETKLATRLGCDLNNNQPNLPFECGLRAFMFDCGDQSKIPYLEVTYTTPSIPSEIRTDKNSLNLHSGFIIQQNYPNPFNSSTLINYQLLENDYVEVTVYDLNGREIEKLVNERQNAGDYNISWGPLGLPSGNYFCRISTKSSCETIRMTLVQ